MSLFCDSPLPRGSYVVAIDVGIMNLGLCVFDFNTGQVVHWDRVTLCHGRYVPANNVQYIRDFIRRNEHFFSHLYVLLIERQIRCNMRIVEAVLQALFFDRTIVISARSIKVHFGISTKNYRSNKAKAVEWARIFMNANPTAFRPGVTVVFDDASKRDDLADSLLLLMYYLDTYSNQLTNQVCGYAHPAPTFPNVGAQDGGLGEANAGE